MNTYILVITIIGIASLGMAWFPSISKRTHISYAVIYVLLGIVLYTLLPHKLPPASPLRYTDFTIHLTELVVIISLMGTDLKLTSLFRYAPGPSHSDW